jgi:cbb3-type cytochrome oxidase subunit 3
MLSEIWQWIGQLSNSKILALLIFFPLFVGIVWYVYSNRQRSERLESYKYMPFQDEESETELKPGEKHEQG